MKRFHRRLGKKSRRRACGDRGMKKWLFFYNPSPILLLSSCPLKIFMKFYVLNKVTLCKHNSPNVLSDFLISILFNSSKFSLCKKSTITPADHFKFSDNVLLGTGGIVVTYRDEHVRPARCRLKTCQPPKCYIL